MLSDRTQLGIFLNQNRFLNKKDNIFSFFDRDAKKFFNRLMWLENALAARLEWETRIVAARMPS